jgi:hypothetical protein
VYILTLFTRRRNCVQKVSVFLFFGALKSRRTASDGLLEDSRARETAAEGTYLTEFSEKFKLHRVKIRIRDRTGRAARGYSAAASKALGEHSAPNRKDEKNG